jgi:hypothetical protein
LQRNRFPEVAHEKHLGESGAALRAVQHRHGPIKAQCRQGAAYGLAGFQRIDR